MSKYDTIKKRQRELKRSERRDAKATRKQVTTWEQRAAEREARHPAEPLEEEA
jgi:hypothetical protein